MNELYDIMQSDPLHLSVLFMQLYYHVLHRGLSGFKVDPRIGAVHHDVILHPCQPKEA